jgi:hypothetical protein
MSIVSGKNEVIAKPDSFTQDSISVWDGKLSPRLPFKSRSVMNQDNPLRILLEQLNTQYRLSDEFKKKVSMMIDKLDGFPLGSDQVELLAGKVKETYERQMLVETCREETLKSLEKIQNSVSTYSSALIEINQKLGQAETALEKLLTMKNAATPLLGDEVRMTPQDKEKARVMAAFACMNPKNSRVH